MPTSRAARGRAIPAAAVTAAAALAAACGGGDAPVGPTTPTVPTTSFAGQAVAVGPASAAGLRFFARRDAAPAQDYAVALDAAGAFRLDVVLPGADADSLTLAVDVANAASGAARTVRPVVVRAARGTAPRVLRPLLVPRAVVVPAGGSYAGTSLAVSLNAAFTPVCTTAGSANCNSFFPRAWLGGVAVWPEGAFPVPLAFNRGASAGPISDADSAALWGVVRQMERDLGRSLFRPANFADLAAPDSTGFSRGAVLVSIDPSLGATYGYTNWLWDANRSVFTARTRLGSAAVFGASALVTHELLHALGFHHTCMWATVMGGYGCASTRGLSVGDVAGFTLAYQVRAAQLAGAPTTGLAEALAGEQVLELGASRSAVPGVAADRAPAGVAREADASARPRVFRGEAVYEAGAP